MRTWKLTNISQGIVELHEYDVALAPWAFHVSTKMPSDRLRLRCGGTMPVLRITTTGSDDDLGKDYKPKQAVPIPVIPEVKPIKYSKDSEKK